MSNNVYYLTEKELKEAGEFAASFNSSLPTEPIFTYPVTDEDFAKSTFTYPVTDKNFAKSTFEYPVTDEDFAKVCPKVNPYQLNNPDIDSELN